MHAFCVGTGKSTGRLSVNKEHVGNIRQLFSHNWQKLMQCSNRKYNMLWTTVWQVIQKHMHLCAYSLQMGQQLNPHMKWNCMTSCWSYLENWLMMTLQWMGSSLSDKGTQFIWMSIETVCRSVGVKTPMRHLHVKGMMEDLLYLTDQALGCIRNL